MKVSMHSEQKVISGKVIHGRQIGRTIGFPTANLDVNSEEKLLLSKGVYAVNVYHRGLKHHGVMNIGLRPTFKDEEPKLSYEVYILDFNADIYGAQLIIEIRFFIRDEVAFASIDQLKEQLKADIEKATKQLLHTEQMDEKLPMAT